MTHKFPLQQFSVPWNFSSFASVQTHTKVDDIHLTLKREQKLPAFATHNPTIHLIQFSYIFAQNVALTESLVNKK